MKIAIVGTGFVADYYMVTLANHPGLELLGVADRNLERVRHFAAFHGVRHYDDYAQLLADPRVELVVNLTNPGSHYEVSRAALLAGKHVYSEKPLSTSWQEAKQLVELAGSLGLSISGAPCGVLGESAQTLGKVLRDGRLGPVRLIYAELDDGPVHLMGYQGWQSTSGNPWPAQDEFEVGCTLEHAGYWLTWLCGLFGPARRVTSFASVLAPDKGIAVAGNTADFSVGCIEWPDGMVARLTCSIFGPHDHTLRVIGDRGVLTADESWDYGTPLRWRARTPLGIRFEKYPRLAVLAGQGPKRIRLARKADFKWKARGANRMDFSRGIAEQAAALRERRPCRLSPGFTLHVNEIVLALQDPAGMGSPRELESSFEPPEPMPWAR